MTSTHTLSIHLYANLKEKAGTDCLELEVPQTCTVDELKSRLKQAYPTMAFHLNKVVFTIESGQIFYGEEVLPLNAEITILPPFGGG